MTCAEKVQKSAKNLALMLHAIKDPDMKAHIQKSLSPARKFSPGNAAIAARSKVDMKTWASECEHALSDIQTWLTTLEETAPLAIGPRAKWAN